MEDIKKAEPKVETSPQILEMQQTMQELSTRLELATKTIAEKDQALKAAQDTSAKVTADKLAKEKNLKEAFGLNKVEQPKRSPDDINSLTNVEMFEVIADVVESSIEATRQEAEHAIDQNFKGLESKFDGVVQHLMKKEADTALNQVRSDNKDFDKYSNDIKEALKNHQEFTYQDAYDWVKMKEAKGDISVRHIDSEKPDKDLSAADEDVVRKKKEPTGRPISSKRQFRNRLEDAVERVQARRGGR